MSKNNSLALTEGVAACVVHERLLVLERRVAWGIVPYSDPGEPSVPFKLNHDRRPHIPRQTHKVTNCRSTKPGYTSAAAWRCGCASSESWHVQQETNLPGWKSKPGVPKTWGARLRVELPGGRSVRPALLALTPIPQ